MKHGAVSRFLPLHEHGRKSKQSTDTVLLIDRIARYNNIYTEDIGRMVLKIYRGYNREKEPIITAEKTEKNTSKKKPKIERIYDGRWDLRHYMQL